MTAARAVALSALAFYTALGFTVVLDDFVDPLGLREYDGAIGSHPATGVCCDPTRGRRRRARRRESTPEGAAYISRGRPLVYSVLDDLLPRLTDLGWHVVDNTELYPAATAAAIRALA